MNTNKEQISSMLFSFSIGCFMQASIARSSFITTIIKQDTWLIAIISFFVGLPILWIWLSLAEMFPGKTIIQINDCVFGPVLGKVFSVMYIWFFFSVAFLNTKGMGDFVTGNLLNETPPEAILIMFIFVCGCAVSKGVETMTRYSTVFFVVAIVFITFNSLMLLKDMKLSNFLPMLSYPMKDYVHATYDMTTLSFCQITVFTMFMPYLPKGANIRKTFYIGFIMGASTILMDLLRSIAVMGPIISMLTNSSFSVIRLVNVGKTLTRVEVTYVILVLMLEFFKTCILIFATVQAITQMLHLKSYKILVPSISVLTICFALTAFDSSVAHSYWGQNIAAPYSILFEVILPAIILITAVAGKLFKVKEVEAT